MADLTELLEELHSDVPERRAAAVEHAAIAVERLIHGVVTALETAGPADKEIFEHIHRFGPTLVAPVEALLHRSTEPGVRTLCGLLLLRLHSTAGLDTLLTELDRGGRFSVPILEQLVRAELATVVPRIIQRLREVPLDRDEEIVALIDALRHFRKAVPADVIPRLQSPGASDAVRSRVRAIIEGTE